MTLTVGARFGGYEILGPLGAGGPAFVRTRRYGRELRRCLAEAQMKDFLMIGRTLGPYKVLGKLGEGGMGEVYRALDVRLRSDVAIKVLPASTFIESTRFMGETIETEVHT